MAFQPRSERRLERQWNAIGTRSTRDRNAIFVRLFLSSTVGATYVRVVTYVHVGCELINDTTLTYQHNELHFGWNQTFVSHNN